MTDIAEIVQKLIAFRDERDWEQYKKLLEKKPVEGKEIVRSIIKNTYRTLMTRGMKGCYVYFIDKETEDFFRSRLADNVR